MVNLGVLGSSSTRAKHGTESCVIIYLTSDLNKEGVHSWQSKVLIWAGTGEAKNTG